MTRIETIEGPMWSWKRRLRRLSLLSVQMSRKLVGEVLHFVAVRLVTLQGLGEVFEVDDPQISVHAVQ